MKLAIRLRNFCKVNMIERKQLAEAKGKLMQAFRQQFIRDAIDSCDGNYESIAEVLGLNYKLVRTEYYAPLHLNSAQYKLETVRHKLLVCNHNHEMAIRKLTGATSEVIHAHADLFEKLVREVNHWSNRMSELEEIRRNITNGEPPHGHVVETMQEIKLPDNIHPIN